MLNNRDADSQICTVQSDRLVWYLYIMDAWLQFVYVSKGTFSSYILVLRFSSPHEFFMLHLTDREADNVQMERKGS